MKYSDALKRLGVMLGGMVALLLVISGVQLITRHRVPGWSEAILILLVAFCTYAVYVRLIERRPVDELSLSALLPQTLMGLAVGVLLFAAVIGLLVLGRNYHYLGYASVPGLFTALLMTAAAAVTEELLFRGFLFRVVQSIGGTWVGVAVSALAFGALHLLNPHATALSSLAIAIEAGALLAMAYAATQRLWLPIGIHIGWNFTEGSIFGVPVSGHAPPPSVFRGALSGCDVVTGGVFGVEASVLAVLVCSVATAFLIVYALRSGRILRPSMRGNRA